MPVIGTFDLDGYGLRWGRFDVVLDIGILRDLQATAVREAGS